MSAANSAGVARASSAPPRARRSPAHSMRMPARSTTFFSRAVSLLIIGGKFLGGSGGKLRALRKQRRLQFRCFQYRDDIGVQLADDLPGVRAGASMPIQ